MTTSPLAAEVLGGGWGNRALTVYLALCGAGLLLIAVADEVVHCQFWRRKRR